MEFFIAKLEDDAETAINIGSIASAEFNGDKSEAKVRLHGDANPSITLVRDSASRLAEKLLARKC